MRLLTIQEIEQTTPLTHSNNNIDQIYFDVSVVSEGDVTVDKIYLWIYN